MKQHFTATKIVLLLGLTAATICISGFREKDSTHHKSFRTQNILRDTTPSGNRHSNTDVELDKAMQRLHLEMQKLDERMKNMDFSKMQNELNEKLSKIDFSKISKEVEASLAKVDWQKINEDVQAAMEKVQKVDMIKMEEEMKKLKENMEKHKIEINIDSEKIRKELSEAMEKTKGSIEKAKVELKLMKEFTDALEADKLIDKKKGYKIDVKDGELYLNDEKQSKDINQKFKKYYKKSNYSIHNDGSDRIRI